MFTHLWSLCRHISRLAGLVNFNTFKHSSILCLAQQVESYTRLCYQSLKWLWREETRERYSAVFLNKDSRAWFHCDEPYLVSNYVRTSHICNVDRNQHHREGYFARYTCSERRERASFKILPNVSRQTSLAKTCSLESPALSNSSKHTLQHRHHRPIFGGIRRT